MRASHTTVSISTTLNWVDASALTRLAMGTKVNTTDIEENQEVIENPTMKLR